MEEGQEAVKAQEEEENLRAILTRRGKSLESLKKKSAAKKRSPPMAVEKLCLKSLQVLERYDSIKSAGRSVGEANGGLFHHLGKYTGQPFEGFH